MSVNFEEFQELCREVAQSEHDDRREIRTEIQQGIVLATIDSERKRCVDALCKLCASDESLRLTRNGMWMHGEYSCAADKIHDLAVERGAIRKAQSEARKRYDDALDAVLAASREIASNGPVPWRPKLSAALKAFDAVTSGSSFEGSCR